LRAKTVEMIKRVKSLLVDHEYMKSRELAEKCGLCVGSICRIIRLMREEGIGILSTKNGYVLSKYAKKPDDVGFLRRLHGRRASDFVALQAAQADIKRRWRSIEDRKQLQLICSPLTANVGRLQAGMKVLLKRSNNKGL